MGETNFAGLSYPEMNDPPNVPNDLAELASDVDRELYRPYPCLSSSRPASPNYGVIIREDDTGNFLRFDGANWQPLNIGGGGGGGGGGSVGVDGQWAASTAQSIPTAADTPIAFGVEEIASAVVTRSTSGSGHKFTLSESGFYQVSATVRFTSGLAGRRFIELRNSAQTVRHAADGYPIGTTDSATLNFSVGKRFDAGTELLLIASQTGQSSLALQPTGIAIVPGFVRLNIAKVTS